MRRVLVTGAGGFVGRPVTAALARQGWQVRKAVRRHSADPHDEVAVGEIGPATAWSLALDGVEAVVHLAALTHGAAGQAREEDFVRVNVAGTRTLAVAARRAGVRRFVFMSSVKVLGEETPDRPFSDSDRPAPVDAYGRTKRDAERALAETGGLDWVVLRPPLVAGPGARGNLALLARLARSRLPLPFARLGNRRSLISTASLAEAVALALERPELAGEAWLVADHPALSTGDLLCGLAGRRQPWLLSCPPSWLRRLLRLVGRGGAAQRLLGSLEVDDARFRDRVGWSPPAERLKDALGAV